MFNSSHHSSERSMQHERDRSMRRESTQRGPSTHRSKSARSLSTSSRHSESKPQWKMPMWVHCEKCYVAHDKNPKMRLLSCGNIFCETCLRVDNALLPSEKIPCPRCKTSETHRPLYGSLDEKLRGMFHQNYMDPILQINLKSMRFMMTKTHNYSKYLAHKFKQNSNLPPEYMDRYSATKKKLERVQKLRNVEKELTTKTELIKVEAAKKYKNTQLLRAYYERKKAEIRRQPSSQHHKQQRNYPPKDMKFISSGRNEHSNQYIGQVKSHRPTNQNQSVGNFRNVSQRVPPPAQRQNVTLNQFRDDSSKHSSGLGSMRPSVQSATFRPKPKDFKSDNHRFEPQSHAQNRPSTSYGYDAFTNPPRRAAIQHPVRREMNLDTSISSVGTSVILNDNHYNPNYNNRHKSSLSTPLYR